MTRPQPYPAVARLWFERPATDLLVVFAVAAGTLAWSTWQGPFWLQRLEPDTRRAVFQTLSTISGTLLGLVLTSISVLNTVLRQPMSGLLESTLHPGRRRAVASLFFAAVRALALALVLNLVALVWDSDAQTGGRWAQSLALAAFVLVALRMGRTLWALALVVTASATDGSKTQQVMTPISDDEY